MDKTAISTAKLNYTLRLQGGIGNQLFQYWAAYFLSQVHGRDLYIDTGEYNASFDFTLMKEIAHHLDFINLKPSRLERLLQKRFMWPYLQRMRIYRETKLTYDPKFWAKSRDAQIIKGYFQSFRYFLDPDWVIEETLGALSRSASEYNKSVLQENCNLVSVHIRRGDYVKNSQTLKYHGVCSDAYYLNAMQLIKRIDADVKFVVFTNDIPYARQLFSDEPIYFAHEIFKPSSDREEMYLMSKCKFNIISNSSFSWWSAYLNQSPGKIVIAPDEWYAFPFDSNDLLPVEWIKFSK